MTHPRQSVANYEAGKTDNADVPSHHAYSRSARGGGSKGTSEPDLPLDTSDEETIAEITEAVQLGLSSSPGISHAKLEEMRETARDGSRLNFSSARKSGKNVSTEADYELFGSGLKAQSIL